MRRGITEIFINIRTAIEVAPKIAHKIKADDAVIIIPYIDALKIAAEAQKEGTAIIPIDIKQLICDDRIVTAEYVPENIISIQPRKTIEKAKMIPVKDIKIWEDD